MAPFSPLNTPDDAAFDSVGSFLEHVHQAKSQSYQAVNEGLHPLLTDPATFVVLPDMARLMEQEVERYGDEALKQICIVALGKWLEYHQSILQEHITNEGMAEALLTMRDIAHLNTAMRLLDEVGSFGGDEDYRKAKHQEISQAVLEHIEESGRCPEDVFNGDNHHSSSF